VRALITGAAGFVGQWLARALLAQGWSVTGGGPEPDAPTPTLTADERAAVRWVRLDVRRVEDVRAALDQCRPDVVFHLAGVTSISGAAGDPGLAVEVNVVGAARLVGEIASRRRAGTLDPVVIVVGTGQQYGRHDEGEMPLTETAEQRPLSVYAASKAAQEIVALEAWRSEGVRIVATRSFNHSGAGQPTSLVLPALVSRALALRGSADRRLRMGNTGTVRDFLHVRDVVAGYILLASGGRAGDVYNVCSGRGLSVAELANVVLRRTGVDAVPFEDPALVRAVEVPVLVGDNSKLGALGWRPTATTNEIIDDVIDAATH
jgi:GDP-4-dehydro-6-deoxy-D-mannose reductase